MLHTINAMFFKKAAANTMASAPITMPINFVSKGNRIATKIWGFLLILLIILSWGCQKAPQNVNGIKEGIILERVEDSRKFRAIKFKKEKGLLVFSKGITFQWPELAYVCPQDFPGPGHQGCECNSNSINGVIDCLDLMSACHGFLVPQSNGTFVCDEAN